MPEEGKDGNIFVAGNVFALYADGGVFGKECAVQNVACSFCDNVCGYSRGFELLAVY